MPPALSRLFLKFTSASPSQLETVPFAQDGAIVWCIISTSAIGSNSNEDARAYETAAYSLFALFSHASDEEA